MSVKKTGADLFKQIISWNKARNHVSEACLENGNSISQACDGLENIFNSIC